MFSKISVFICLIDMLLPFILHFFVRKPGQTKSISLDVRSEHIPIGT